MEDLKSHGYEDCGYLAIEAMLNPDIDVQSKDFDDWVDGLDDYGLPM